MNLGNVEEFIKSLDDGHIRISPRVEEKIRSRDPEIFDLVKLHLKEKPYQGIIKQDGEEYIIVTELSKIYDLITIIRIDNAYVNIKTSFRQEKRRRVSGKWK